MSRTSAERIDVSTSPALDTVVLCVDGSDEAVEAVRSGFALLKSPTRVLLVTVVEESDPMMVTGTGLASGVMSKEEFEELDRATAAEGWATAEREAARIDVLDPEIHVLRGAPGPALCSFAREVQARAIVMGSRGRGGIKRAVLGSVSDHVVRNAPCPVVITGPAT
jgi:nucleotide-binding universal stress UspA family protein